MFRTIRALLWEQWRQTWQLLALSAGTFLLYTLFVWYEKTHTPIENFYPSMNMPIEIAWFIVLTAFAFLFVNGTLRGLRVDFPRRLFVLPVDTVMLVTVQLAYKLAVMTVFAAALCAAGTTLYEVDYAPWLPLAMLLAATAWAQAYACLVTAYGFFRATGLLLVLLAGVLGFWFVSTLTPIPLWGWAGLPLRGQVSHRFLAVGGLGTVLWCLTGIGLVRAYGSRRASWAMGVLTAVLLLLGDASSRVLPGGAVESTLTVLWLGWSAWLVAIGASVTARHGQSAPFSLAGNLSRFRSSPLGAQMWFEWRNTVMYLPMLFPVVLTFGLAGLLLASDLQLLPVSAVLSMIVPAGLACGVGFYLIRCSTPYLVFVGTRPVSHTLIAHAKLLSGLAGTLSTVALLGASWIILALLPGPAFQIASRVEPRVPMAQTVAMLRSESGPDMHAETLALRFPEGRIHLAQEFRGRGRAASAQRRRPGLAQPFQRPPRVYSARPATRLMSPMDGILYILFGLLPLVTLVGVWSGLMAGRLMMGVAVLGYAVVFLLLPVVWAGQQFGLSGEEAMGAVVSGVVVAFLVALNGYLYGPKLKHRQRIVFAVFIGLLLLWTALGMHMLATFLFPHSGAYRPAELYKRLMLGLPVLGLLTVVGVAHAWGAITRRQAGCHAVLALLASGFAVYGLWRIEPQGASNYLLMLLALAAAWLPLVWVPLTVHWQRHR